MGLGADHPHTGLRVCLAVDGLWELGEAERAVSLLDRVVANFGGESGHRTKEEAAGSDWAAHILVHAAASLLTFGEDARALAAAERLPTGDPLVAVRRHCVRLAALASRARRSAGAPGRRRTVGWSAVRPAQRPAGAHPDVP